MQQQRAITAATAHQSRLQKQQQVLAQQIRLKNSSNIGPSINSITNNINRLPNLSNLTLQQQQQLLKLLNNSAHQLTPQLLQAGK